MNRELKNELYSAVDQWVNREFNFIQLDNYRTVQENNGNYLEELIEDMEPDPYEFILNYNLEDDFWEWYMIDNGIDDEDAEAEKKHAIKSGYDQDHETLMQFIEEEQESEFEDWQSERRSENYPVWNTLFEFRSEPSQSWLDKAQEAGLSVFRSTDTYNSLLFATGCGYSFYGAHWIPLYLSIFKYEAEKYKDIDYSDL